MTLDLVWFFVCFDLKTQARLNALKIFVSSIRIVFKHVPFSRYVRHA